MAKDHFERCVSTLSNRTYLLEKKDPIQKFGFTAGHPSQQPLQRLQQRGTVVRYVDPSGPCADLLRIGDIIVEINGVNVEDKSLDTVVKMVQQSDPQMMITVRQPKPQFSSTLPRHHRVNNNIKVDKSEQLRGKCRIFLENGQTKMIQYDDQTTVKDLILSLSTKLAINCGHHFGLTIEHAKSTKRNQLHLLDNNDSISKIANISDASQLKILYRMTFPPQNITYLSNHDKMAFDYLYKQSCNDLVLERYTPELRYENVIKLAALYIVQHVGETCCDGPQFHPNNAKLFLKIVKKGIGLNEILPQSIFNNTKKKILDRHLQASIKKNFQDYDLKPNTIKLIFLNVLSRMPSYGAKLFSTSPPNEAWPTRILINERYGISVLEPTSNKGNNASDSNHANPISQVTIDLIRAVKLVKRFDKEKNMCIIEIYTRTEDFSEREPLKLSLVKDDSKEFITTLKGYYKAISANKKLQNFDGSQISYKSLDSIELEVLTCDWPGERESMSSLNFATPQPPSISDNQQNHTSTSTVSMSSSERSIERSLPSDEPVYANRGYDAARDRRYGLSMNRGYRRSINREYGLSRNMHDLIDREYGLSRNIEDPVNRECGTPMIGSEDIRMSYKNVIGFNCTERTTTPSSFIGDTSDLTNVHKIQLDLDNDRHITIAVDVNKRKSEFFDSHNSRNTIDNRSTSTVDWVDAAHNGYNTNTESKYPTLSEFGQTDIYKATASIGSIHEVSHDNVQQSSTPQPVNHQPDIFQRTPSVRKNQENSRTDLRQSLSPEYLHHTDLYQVKQTPKIHHDDFIFPSPPFLQNENVTDPVSELAAKFSTVDITDKDIESWIFPTPPKIENFQDTSIPVVPTIRRSKVQNQRNDANQMQFYV